MLALSLSLGLECDWWPLLGLKFLEERLLGCSKRVAERIW